MPAPGGARRISRRRGGWATWQAHPNISINVNSLAVGTVRMTTWLQPKEARHGVLVRTTPAAKTLADLPEYAGRPT